MLEQKIAIYNALYNSQDLINLNLNITISAAWPNKNATYPYISYYQVAGSAQLIDGKNSLLNEIYSIDIFATTQTDIENITTIVNQLMNELPYLTILNANIDNYEQDSNIYHKILRYRIKSCNS